MPTKKGIGKDVEPGRPPGPPAGPPGAVPGALQTLAEWLPFLGDGRPATAVEALRLAYDPAPVAMAIDGLVARLGGPGSGPALALLARLGGRPQGALTVAFMRTKDAAVQRDVVEALARMAPLLDPGRWYVLMLDAEMILPPFAADDTVRQGLEGLADVLRRCGEKLGGAGRPANTETVAVASPGSGG